MIHFGAAGVFGAPRANPEPLPADRFRKGETWRSPRGIPHTVLQIEGGRAHLLNLNTQRTASREATDLGSPRQPWTLLSRQQDLRAVV